MMNQNIEYIYQSLMYTNKTTSLQVLNKFETDGSAYFTTDENNGLSLKRWVFQKKITLWVLIQNCSGLQW